MSNQTDKSSADFAAFWASKGITFTSSNLSLPINTSQSGISALPSQQILSVLSTPPIPVILGFSHEKKGPAARGSLLMSSFNVVHSCTFEDMMSEVQSLFIAKCAMPGAHVSAESKISYVAFKSMSGTWVQLDESQWMALLPQIACLSNNSKRKIHLNAFWATSTRYAFD